MPDIQALQVLLSTCCYILYVRQIRQWGLLKRRHLMMNETMWWLSDEEEEWAEEWRYENMRILCQFRSAFENSPAWPASPPIAAALPSSTTLSQVRPGSCRWLEELTLVNMRGHYYSPWTKVVHFVPQDWSLCAPNWVCRASEKNVIVINHLIPNGFANRLCHSSLAHHDFI